MRDFQPFLRAIIKRPDDDLPRLVAADWLDEHSEPERAEFIRVQCEIARLQTAEGGTDEFWVAIDARHDSSCQCRRHTLRRRESDLLGLPHPDGGNTTVHWSRPISCLMPYRDGDGTVYRFRRGFVDEISTDLRSWLAHHEAIRAATPLKRVMLTTWPEGARQSNLGRTVTAMQLQGMFPGVDFELLPTRTMNWSG